MPVRVGTGLLLLLLLAATITWALTRDGDPVQQRTLAELDGFTAWLEAHGAQGYIGEVGWPDDPRWEALADRWYTRAASADLWVTAWATGELWPLDSPLAIYRPAVRGGPLAVPGPQAALLERQDPDRRGITVSGGEFGYAPQVEPTSPWSNVDPGTYGHDWLYDSQASFDYLASRRITTVRLPFRWERIQPIPGGPLDRAELGRLTAAVERADAAGLWVILDVHNYGSYYLHDGRRGVRRVIGSPELPEAHFADLWRRLSQEFADTPVVRAYSLMNEPVGSPEEGEAAAADVWEQASQAAVDAIRGNGDDKLILVPGYDWAAVRGWADRHPTPWITDPLDNIRYEAHHYWDSDASGAYRQGYGEEAAGGSS